MASSYRPTETVVVVGHGVGQIASIDGERMTVHLSEGDVSVSLADADSLIRPIVDPGGAKRFLDRLCERCTEARSLPVLRSIRELARAPLERQVAYSRWYFRKKNELEPKEIDIVLAVSEGVLAELAAALGVSESELRAAVKRGKPTIVPQTKRTLPAAPALAGCKFWRSFWLGPVAIVGEGPEQDGSDVIRVSVKPGAWHAYWVEESDEGDGDSGGLLIRHEELSADLPMGGGKIDVGGVNLEGGEIGVLDAAALTEPEFGVDEVERLRRDGLGFGDRGVETPTGGDGDHRVLVDDTNLARVIFLPL